MYEHIKREQTVTRRYLLKEGAATLGKCAFWGVLGASMFSASEASVTRATPATPQTPHEPTLEQYTNVEQHMRNALLRAASINITDENNPDSGGTGSIITGGRITTVKHVLDEIKSERTALFVPGVHQTPTPYNLTWTEVPGSAVTIIAMDGTPTTDAIMVAELPAQLTTQLGQKVVPLEIYHNGNMRELSVATPNTSQNGIDYFTVLPNQSENGVVACEYASNGQLCSGMSGHGILVAANGAVLKYTPGLLTEGSVGPDGCSTSTSGIMLFLPYPPGYN